MSDAADPPVQWTFMLPGLPRTAGGLVAAYELASALAAEGSDRVLIAHLPTPEARLRSTADIPWFRFPSQVEHLFLEDLDPRQLPDGDLVVYTVMAIELALAADPEPGARDLLVRLQEEPGPAGLPLLFLQALGVFSAATELRALAGTGPKVCVASWMADSLVEAGSPASEVITIPNGVNHEVFRPTTPIAGRPAGVAMNHNPHPLKNMDAAVAALQRVTQEVDVPVVLYGARPPARLLPAGVRFEPELSQVDLAERVLAASSVYLQPSAQEGFGLCALEAMACGCALVTTDNGGSHEYAIDGETAVICEPDVESMADAVVALLRDDARRIRIATAGAKHAEGLRWSDGAERLRAFGRAYLADPSGHRRGPARPFDDEVLHLRR